MRPALLWLSGVWTRIDGGRGPPLTAAVWLQAAQAAWQPQRSSHGQLWRELRVAMLNSAWELRTRRAVTGRQFGSEEVIAAFVEVIRGMARADWQRVVSNITNMTGTHRSWFPGLDPAISVVEFERRWCGGGVIAYVAPARAGGQPTLELRLSAED